MCLLKLHHSVPVDSVIKARVELPTATAKEHKGFLTFYAIIVIYLREQHATAHNVSIFDADMQTFKVQGLRVADCTQQIWTKTLSYGSVYVERMLKDLFIEGVNKSIYQTDCQWWSGHRSASLEDLAQKVDQFTNLQRIKQRVENRLDTERARGRRKPRTSSGRHRRNRRVTNIEQPPLSRSPGAGREGQHQ